MKSETRAANLAETGKSRLTLAEIRAEKQRLEQEEAEIIRAEAAAKEQQRQRAIAAALSSVESALQPVKSAFDQADAELAAAVTKINQLAKVRDAAAEQLKSTTNGVRRSLANAGVPTEQINSAIASYEIKRKAVALLTNQISFVKPYSDALQEIQNRTHWFQVGETQSLVVIVTRRAG